MGIDSFLSPAVSLLTRGAPLRDAFPVCAGGMCLAGYRRLQQLGLCRTLTGFLVTTTRVTEGDMHIA